MASYTFDKILRDIQSSNLNFQMQVSPFSALISLKKSIVKEKDGSYRAPVLPSEYESVVHKKELDGIRHDYLVAVDECAKKTEELVASKNTIVLLEEKLAKSEAKALKLFEEKKSENDIFKKQVKVLHSEKEDLKKEIKILMKTQKEKEKEEYRLQSKCDNLEGSVKMLKNEASVLRNENKKLKKGNPKKPKVALAITQTQTSSTDAMSAATHSSLPTISTSSSHHPDAFENNNILPSLEYDDDQTTLATSISCLSVAEPCQPLTCPSSSPESPLTPARLSTLSPLPPATPTTPRTPPGFLLGNKNVYYDPDGMEEIVKDLDNQEPKITVQGKLKEAIKSGEKLDFKTVVSLIENHPWNEPNEGLENDDEYDYDAIDYDDYETYSAEENNCS